MSQSSSDMLVAKAVHNNAVWCDTVCRSHEVPGEFLDTIWICRHETPPFYPNADTLTGGGVQSQLAAIRSLMTAGPAGEWAVKDSFATLDLHPLGFEPLFDASWIARQPTDGRTDRTAEQDLVWRKVTTPGDLRAWELAWRDEPGSASTPIFLPLLLSDPAVTFMAGYRGSTIIAGGIANLTNDVVGISNMFQPVAADIVVKAACIAAIIDLFPGRPLVGYEAGDDLGAMLALGFEPLGPLRVWARRPGGTQGVPS